jgi:hypothetical protein
MREAVAFYRRWLGVAFHGTLDRTALVAFLFLSGLDASKHFVPVLRQVIESWLWAVPFWALAAVLLVRVFAAPLIMWREDRANAAAIESQVADLRVQLAARSAPPARNPNRIYQHRTLLGEAFAVRRRIGDGIVTMHVLQAHPDFNEKVEFEYQELQLIIEQYNATAIEGRMGITTRKDFLEVACRVQGRIS